MMIGPYWHRPMSWQQQRAWRARKKALPIYRKWAAAKAAHAKQKSVRKHEADGRKAARKRK